MEILNFINESRVEDFKSRYSQKFPKEIVQKILESIPPKFLDWVGKNFDLISSGDLSKITNLINKFEKVSSNLSKSDLYQYKSIAELENEIKKFDEKQRRVVKKTEGGNVVYEDSRFFVVNPLTHKSSCYYGKGTKWCTASETDTHFTKYNDDGKLFYIIDKKLRTDDPFYKVALLYKFDKGKSWWDAKDISFNKGWIFDSEEYDKLINSIDGYMNSQYEEQIKIWTDKEMAKKEKERLEKLRQERRMRELSDEANERRTENSWQLGPDCPEEGLKAHALLDWLVDTSDIQVITNEDRLLLQRLKDEAERLESQFDTDEETRQNNSYRIDEIEEEINELESKIDVYNIVPVGDYYDCTEFEVINSPDLETRRYAVGTEDETNSSAKEALQILIDDIGIRGFTESFAKQYLDLDKIQQEAEQVYEDDVFGNPEVYLDDSERELSSKQAEKVSILERRIAQFQKQLENFSEFIQGDNSDEDDKIANQIEIIEDEISEIESEIEDIKSDPQGDFPSDLIDEKISELVNGAMENPEYFLNELGLNWENFIDVDEFIDGAIDADGLGHVLNHYDGNADEVYVQDILFYVMRID